MGLKWEDLDLDTNTLQVRRTSRNPVWAVSRSSSRTVRVGAWSSRTAVEALRAYREIHREYELMLATEKGTPVNSSNLVHRSFKPLLKSCGVPRIRFHDLRHTCATTRFLKGQHPKRVSNIPGNSSGAITLNIYISRDRRNGR